jgi:macrodomain Ter protein organizer (MatP/YcbG family)
MARAAKSKKADPLREAAVDYFSSRSHNAWRKRLLETNPEQRGQPRMRPRGGVMVDINKPWASLDPKAKADNKRAAYDAYDAVKRFPDDREAASNYVHERWMARNKGDKTQPKALFKAYARLPEVEKDKDRAHVDRMKAALRAVTPKRKRKSKAKAAATKTVRLDAKTWARLEAAARSLSKALGRKVTPEALLVAAAEAVAAVAKAAPKTKKA